MSLLANLDLPENRCPIFLDDTHLKITFKGVSLDLLGSGNTLVLTLPPVQQLQDVLQGLPSKSYLMTLVTDLDKGLRFYGISLIVKAGQMTVWSMGAGSPVFNKMAFEALTIFLK